MEYNPHIIPIWHIPSKLCKLSPWGRHQGLPVLAFYALTPCEHCRDIGIIAGGQRGLKEGSIGSRLCLGGLEFRF